MSTRSLEQLSILENTEDGSIGAEEHMRPVTRRQQTVVLLSSFMAVFQTIGKLGSKGKSLEWLRLRTTRY